MNQDRQKGHYFEDTLLRSDRRSTHSRTAGVVSGLPAMHDDVYEWERHFDTSALHQEERVRFRQMSDHLIVYPAEESSYHHTRHTQTARHPLKVACAAGAVCALVSFSLFLAVTQLQRPLNPPSVSFPPTADAYGSPAMAEGSAVETATLEPSPAPAEPTVQPLLVSAEPDRLVIPSGDFSDTILRTGVRGENVELLQSALISLGYLASGSEDGVFGSGTKSAVKAFQENNGLKADGVAGPNTLVILYSGSAVESSSPPIISESAATDQRTYVWKCQENLQYHENELCPALDPTTTTKIAIDEARLMGLGWCPECKPSR